jgi:hypothetical protein
MALIVENGTGLTDADSYISLAAFKAYADDRGYDYSAFADQLIEQKLRLGTQYVDTIQRYKAQRLLATQALEFPREELYDWSGLLVTGVPMRVKHATAELAFRALSGELYADLDRGGQVQSESVAGISVTYKDGAPVGRWFTFAMNLLEPYKKEKKDLMGTPKFGGADTGYFVLDQHKNPAPGAEY